MGTGAVVGSTIGGVFLSVSLAFDGVDPPAPAPGLTVGGIITGEQDDLEIDAPNANPHEDWFIFQFLSAGNDMHSGNNALQIKSMRKIEEIGDDFVVVFESLGTGTPGSVTGIGWISTLLLLA